MSYPVPSDTVVHHAVPYIVVLYDHVHVYIITWVCYNEVYRTYIIKKHDNTKSRGESPATKLKPNRILSRKVMPKKISKTIQKCQDNHKEELNLNVSNISE